MLLQILCTPLTFFVRIPVLNESEEVTEEDIREMIQTSQESGHIEEPQKELFDNVFEFDDTSVEEICTHRSEVVCLYLEDDMNQWKQVIHDNRHTFIPSARKMKMMLSVYWIPETISVWMHKIKIIFWPMP